MSALIPLFTVHCFWAKCSHVEQDIDSYTASRRMQAHYDEAHEDDLVALGYGGAA